MPTDSKTQTSEKQLLDVFELGERWKRHPVTIRVDHTAGRIPAAIRIGKALRWRIADVKAFEDGTWRPAGLKKQAVTQ